MTPEDVGDTYYEILDVSPTADQSQIKAAYRRMIRLVHPDHGGSHALFRQVQSAYETLSDPGRRASYDEWLRTGTTKNSTEDDGWERVDESEPPPPGRPNSAPPPPGRGAGYPPPQPPPAGAHGRGHFFSRHPTTTVGLIGVALLYLASAMHSLGLTLLGLAVIVIAGIAALGRRRAREREAHQGSGIGAVDSMSGTQFELLLLHLFESKGYQAKHVGGRGDYGADLLLDDGIGRIAVQAKRLSRPVGHDAVQEVVAAKAYYGAFNAIVVTNSTFTPHARNLAVSNGVELWDRRRLSQEMSAFADLPTRSAASRFRAQFTAGLPMILNGLLAVLFALGSSKGGRRR